jgi:hemolysin activation/secretion protein
MRRTLPRLVPALLALLAPAAAPAQVPALQTPREEFALPPAEPAPPPAERILPEPPPPPAPERLAGGVQVRVQAFDFRGNSVFSDAELAQVVAPWTGRVITSAELQAASQAVTRFYVDRGYVNSGALIPDQRVEDGRVALEVIEGRLTGVRVEGTRWFRPSYFEKRLMIDSDRPLQVENLEERLQLLQQDRRIRRLNARLGPGAERGEAVLDLRVEEETPFHLGVQWSNDEPSSVGEQTGRIRAELPNLTGNGDELRGVVAFTEGLTDAEVRYRLPMNRWDTSFETRYRISGSDIVEGAFETLGFRSVTKTLGFGLLQPLYRSPSAELRIGIIGEWRRNRTTFETLSGQTMGIGFPGTGADPETGITRIGVLRLGGEWVRRTRSQVLALRSLVSVGIPVFDATRNPGDEPDSRFVSWLTQFQWVQRLPARWGEEHPELRGVELVFRADLQLASRPLVPMEQFAVGGLHTVRGYRENQMVRDQGVIGSLEIRVPIWRSAGERHLVQLAPFVDTGHAWNRSRATPGEFKTITGIGIGLRYRFVRGLFAEFYAAENLRDVPRVGESSLQRRGLHFLVRLDLI